MKTCLKALLVICGLLLPVLCFASGNEPISSVNVPDLSSSTGISDLAAYNKNELPAVLAKYFPTGLVINGGIHGTSASCTSDPITLDAFTSTPSQDHISANAHRGSAAINYGSSGIGANCSGGTSVCWVVASSAGVATLPSSNFHQAGTSNFYADCSSSTRPALPAKSVWLMLTFISGGQITPAPIDLRPSLWSIGANQPLNIHGSNTLPEEVRAIQGDIGPDEIISGCNPLPSVTTTIASFACNAYVRRTDGSLIYMRQPSASFALTGGDGTYWLLVYEDTYSAVSGWTRPPQTAYGWQKSATKPTRPAGGLIFAQVTVAGNAVTVVEEIGTRHITGTETVADNRTVGQSGIWRIDAGGGFTIASGKTLTMAGLLQTPLQTIKSGSGSLVFRVGTPTREVFPQWWGGIPSDGVSDYAAMKAAHDSMASGQILHFTSGQWDENGGGEILSVSKSNITILCDTGTTLKQNATRTQVIYLLDNIAKVKVLGCTFQDTGTFDAGFRGRGLLQSDPLAGGLGVKDIEIAGNHFDAGAISGISGVSMTQWNMHDNRFEHPGGAYGEHGMYVSSGGTYILIHHNVFVSSGTNLGAAITSNAGVNDTVGFIGVTDNLIHGFNYGIQPASSGNFTQPAWRIQNNTIIANTGSTGAGISFFSVIPTTAIVSGNIVQGWPTNGLENDAAQRDGITLGNIFSGNGQNGARVVGLTRSTIAINIFANNNAGSVGVTGDTGSGLRIVSTDDRNFFFGNAAYRSSGGQLYGISMGATAQTNNVFVGNYTYGNVTADLDVTGVSGQTWLHIPNTLTMEYGDEGSTAGSVNTPALKLVSGSYIESREVTAPAAPAAHYARIYTKASGGGKTETCWLFSTGAEQCPAVQP